MYIQQAIGIQSPQQNLAQDDRQLLSVGLHCADVVNFHFREWQELSLECTYHRGDSLNRQGESILYSTAFHSLCITDLSLVQHIRGTHEAHIAHSKAQHSTGCSLQP